MLKKIAVSILCLSLLSACAADGDSKKAPSDIPSPVLEYQFLVDVPGWQQDDHAAAFHAFQRSCDRFARKKDDIRQPLKDSGIAGTYEDWQAVCNVAATIDPAKDGAARQFFEQWFTAYLVRDAESEKSDGLFTGYYEPLLHGSLEKTTRYNVPLYKKPDDLVEVNLGAFRATLKGQNIAGRVEKGRLVPYHDRAEIGKGALKEKGEVLLWVDDPVQAFFLHIQGSGRVKFEDGTEMRVGYAGQNGHVYYAIGKYLVENGTLPKEKVTMPAIRDYLAAHPDEAEMVMNKNASYIFFRELEGADGPLGAEGIALTEGRSLAVDRRIFPYGMPVWLDLDGVFTPEQRIRRLVVAQDTGGAIRGAVRGDVFWGHGAEAENNAGHMKSRGRYWVLLPRFVTVPDTLAWEKQEQGFFKTLWAKIPLPSFLMASAKD
ncbi:MAG: murein transglycosylase [Alphaproteobacteria bacterium]|nr:MAG: murein transglycosylase [Alphaproteobacteria bacterium]